MLGRSLVVVALLAAAVPVAQAQLPVAAGAMEIALQGVPTQPILPAIDSPGFTATLTLACAEADRAAAAVQSVLYVGLAFATGDGVVITGPSSIALDTAPCLEGAASVEASEEYQVSVPRSAPGLQPIAGTATAHAEPRSDPFPTPADATAAFTVTPDYYSLNEAELPSKLKTCDPCERVEFPLQVSNLGNAPTRYTMVMHLGGDDPAWTVELPAPIVVRPGESATWPVYITGSGGEHAFQFGILPAAADDPAKAGNALTFNVLVRDAGSRDPLDAPSPVAPLAILLLLGLALLARRRA